MWSLLQDFWLLLQIETSPSYYMQKSLLLLFLKLSRYVSESVLSYQCFSRNR